MKVTRLAFQLIMLFSIADVSASIVTVSYTGIVNAASIGGTNNDFYQVEYKTDTNALPFDTAPRPIIGEFSRYLVDGTITIGTATAGFSDALVIIANNRTNIGVSGDTFGLSSLTKTFDRSQGKFIETQVIGNINGVTDFEFGYSTSAPDFSVVNTAEIGEAITAISAFNFSTVTSINSDVTNGGAFSYAVVPVAVVPVPAAVWLFGSGLGFLCFTAHRKTTA